MFNYKSNISIRIIFLLLIAGAAILFFVINVRITDQFRTELNNQVRTIVNVYHEKGIIFR